ncbi:MAG: vitamin B12 dependent-methionine synthase activation domain-containing protein [Candidatus Theseobacter exili]|nr:vitamin B12 dependent-methionine synthase activation domain-containing protein [Candidatus Theseobacter exili]
MSVNQPVKLFQPENITIPERKVLLRLGYRDGKTLFEGKAVALVSQLLENAKLEIEWNCHYRHHLIDLIDNDQIELNECPFFLKSRDLANHLKRSSKITFFALTLGNRFFNYIENYSKEKRVAEAAVLDAVGSEAVEAFAEKFSSVIKDLARRDRCSITKRYSPGYGDWNLGVQKNLLSWLSAEKIGISLESSGIMIPEKSITGVIGWKRNG